MRGPRTFEFFVQFYFRRWVHLRTKNPISLKRHLLLHGNRLDVQIFRSCPPSRFFSYFSSSALKRHLLKRHFALSKWWDAWLTQTTFEAKCLNCVQTGIATASASHRKEKPRNPENRRKTGNKNRKKWR